MAAPRPCSRREFIRKLRTLGYEGPYAGGNHSYMERTGRASQRWAKTVTVPNTDLDVGLVEAHSAAKRPTSRCHYPREHPN